MSRIPWRALALVLSLLAAHRWTAAAELLIYERAAILHGEWWRLLSGHWVHFTDAHLLYDLLVVGATGWLIENRRAGDLPALGALTILLTGPILMLAEPELKQFGGASGIAYAFVVYVALSGLADPGRWRVVCGLLLGVIGLKLLVEWGAGWSLSTGMSRRDFVPVPLSHLVGVGTALGLWLWRVRRGLRARLYRTFISTSTNTNSKPLALTTLCSTPALRK